DIVIQTEEVSRIVFLFDGGQAREIGAERCVDDLFDFNVERGKEMRVRRKRPKDFFAGPGPVAVDRRLGRVGPLSDKQNIPAKIAMWKRGGIVRNTASSAAVV